MRNTNVDMVLQDLVMEVADELTENHSFESYRHNKAVLRRFIERLMRNGGNNADMEELIESCGK